MISFSEASRLNAYKVETSTAIGIDSATVRGTDRPQEFGDDTPRQPLPDELAEPLRDVLQQQQRRQRRKGKDQRSDVLLEDVFVEYLHGVKYTGGLSDCDPAATVNSGNPALWPCIHRRVLSVSIALAIASAGLDAQQPTRDTVKVKVPADTTRAPADTTRQLPLPGRPAPRPRLRLDSLALRLPPVLSRADRETYRQAAEQIEAARATAFQQNRRAIIEAVWGQVATSSFATAEQPPAYPGDAPKPPKTVAARAGDIISDHTDMGLQLNGRMEFRGEKNTSEQCAAGGFNAVFNCRSAFNPLIDFQFNTRSGGVIADRVHVDVDYDTQREFDGSNNISINYEGKGKEFLQRLEIGNVTFQPPVSRFITAGIPSGNYGIQAITQIGPARVRTILAQQKGNIVSDRVFTVGAQTLQAVDRRIEDHQFEPRRFFFTVSPKLFGAAYPNIDILDSRRMTTLAMSLPDTLRPTKIFLYRLLIGGQPPSPSGPQFRILGDPLSRRGQVYERLREGVDYYVDPSQLWVALLRPLSLNSERLVVAYRVNINGRDTIHVTTGGTPDLEYRADAEQFANLLWDPRVTPGDPAFDREIRSVYRLGGPDVRRQSVVVKIVTGSSEDQEKTADETPGGAATFLQLFGLAQKTNSSSFDLENRIWPRPSDPNFELSLGASLSHMIRDQFLVFPSLRPFASNGLAGKLNPSNDTIYSTPSEYVKSAQRPLSVYHIRARYQAEGSGEGGTLMLGTVQVRPNSERLLMDGIPLVRGTDYTVDYDLGRVSFARPDTLFVRPRQVSVQFEENPVFAETPTSIFGATAEIPFPNGTLNFTALSQTQKTTFNRPPLGFEPAGSLMAGVTALFNFDASPLTSLVSRLPYGATTAPSRISVSGEFAASRPQPNAAGQAYLESFEGEGGIQVSLLDAQWYYSSQPALGRLFPLRYGAQSLDLSRAATLAWQGDGLDATGNPVRYTIEQIDPLTALIGTGLSGPEPILWMTLYPLGIGGLRGEGNFKWTVGNAPTGRRWRSIRTPLGPTGSDLSRVESIEFWAQINVTPGKREKNPLLMLDFGDVSENSVAFAPDTLTVHRLEGHAAGRDSVYTGRKIQGFDRLDSERDPFSRAFNVGVNDNGLPGDVASEMTVITDTLPGLPAQIKTVANFGTCRNGYAFVRVLGDSRVDCTIANNRLDEEDIDGDNVLNLTSAEREQEQLRRYIVNLADESKFNRVGKCSLAHRVVVGPPPDSVCWVLFRIPFRAPDDSLGAPLLRRMRAVRITMLSGDGTPDNEFSQVAIARLRLTGAPWIKRRDTGLRGIGAELPGRGFVNAGVIGTQDRGLATGISYESPPGVVDQPDTKQSNFQTNRVQVNEHSLRITAGDLGVYDRAEAYFRFPEGDKNFMAYKEMRLWARGVRNGWTSWRPSVLRQDRARSQQLLSLSDDAERRERARCVAPGNPCRFPQAVQPARGDSERISAGPNAKQLHRPRFLSHRQHAGAVGRNPLHRLLGGRIHRLHVGSRSESAQSCVGAGAVGGNDSNRHRQFSARPIAPGDTLELWVDDIRLGGVVDAAGFAGQMGVSVLAGDFADIRLNLSRRDPNFRQLAEQPTFLTDNSVNVSSAFHLEKLLPRSFGLAIPFSVNYTSASIDPLFVSQTDVQADIVDGLRTPRSSATSVTLSIARATPLKDSRLAPLWNNLALTSTYTSAAARSEYEDGSAHNFTVGLDYNLSNALLPGMSRWAPAELHFTSVYTNGSDQRFAFLKPAFAPRRQPSSDTRTDEQLA